METNNNEIQSSQTELENSSNNNRRFQVYIIVFGFGLLLVLLIIVGIRTFAKSEDSSLNEDKNIKVTKAEPKEFKIKEDKTDDFFLNKKNEEPIKEEVTQITNNQPFGNPMMFKEVKYTAKIVKGNSNALVKKDSFASNDDEINKTANAEQQKILNSMEKPLGTDNDFVGDTFTPTSATLSKFNPDLLLPKGSYIGCSLNTRFVSTIKGGISCTVSDNVYSSNGKVLLIEKGSKLNGMFKSGQMNDGMNRYFVIWQEVRTPNNLVIPLYSGASDELGGAGIEGYVDHKWMLRFGSAVLLSAVDDMFNVMAWSITKNNDNADTIDYTENSRENAKNMASIALENFINIKPTLYKNHGDLVGVYVNRDIDFSKVYKLTRK